MAYSLLRTYLLNYRLFPRDVARLLPLKVGRHVDTRGLKRGAIRFRDCVQPHRFMVRLGVTSWPLYSEKSMHTWLWLHAGASLVLGDDVDINDGTRIVVTSGATLELGDGFFVNQNSLLYCTRSIRFGQRCCLGWDCQVSDTDFHLLKDMETGIVRNPSAPVTVGDDVWLAARVVVGKGVSIASGAVVAAGSVVCKPLAEQGLYAGVPAVLKRRGVTRVTDKKEERRLRKAFRRHPDAGELPSD